MKKRTIALAMAMIFLAAIAADSVSTSARVSAAPQSQVFTMPEAGIQFQLPAGWRAKRDGNDIYVWTRDEALQTIFFVPESDTFDQTLRQLDKELGRTIKKIKTTEKDTSDTLNGMRHFATGGTAEFEGSPIEWGVDILQARKVVIALFFAAPGAFDDNAKNVDQFIESIKTVSTAARPPAAPAPDDRVLTNPDAGLQFELPRGWRAEEKGDDLLVWTADGTVQIDIWLPGDETFDVALRNLDKDLSKVVKNIKILDRGTSDTHNGMRHFSTAGTGTVDGRRCEWSVDVLDARRVALVLSFWSPGRADRHAAEGEQFFNSIKKMN